MMDSNELAAYRKTQQEVISLATEQNISELAERFANVAVHPHLDATVMLTGLPLWQVVDVIITFHWCIAHAAEIERGKKT